MNRFMLTLCMLPLVVTLISCDKPHIANEFVEIIKNEKSAYKYTMVVSGVLKYNGHSSNILTALFKGKQDHKVKNIFEFKTRKGIFSPDQFRFKWPNGEIMPKESLKGSVIIEEKTVTINITYEDLKDHYVPYYFNGIFKIQEK